MRKKGPAKKRTNHIDEGAPSLLSSLIRDLLVTHWFVSFLTVTVVCSAMLLANTSHDVRRAVAKSQQLREQRQQKEIEWQTLRLEMTSLSETNRISSLAKKQLNMIEVNNKNEKIITL